MFDIFSADYWTNAVMYMFVFWQSGFNMIPQIGWNQAVEAWAYSKAGDK